MELNTIDLVAGQDYPLPVEGHYMRLLTCEGLITVDTDTGWRTQWLAGVGGRFSRASDGEPFRKLTFNSPIDQEVRVLTSPFLIDDSRLSGDIDVNGLLQVLASAPTSRRFSTVTIPATSNIQVLPEDTTRKAAIIQASGAWHLGSDNTVDDTYILAAAGNTADENSGALWGYNPSGSAITLLIAEDII